jgi:hypothetical protein
MKKKSSAIQLNQYENAHYQNELWTAGLVKECYSLRLKKKRMTPEKLHALCQLTWGKGNKLRPLWTLWEKSGEVPILSDYSKLKDYGFPQKIVNYMQYDIGIVNFYAAYHNSSYIWIKRNFKTLSPMVHKAATLKNDDEARELIETIQKLPGIPKPIKRSSKISATSLLTPLFCCLDPRMRFPIINKAEHVINLHTKLGISGFTTIDKFNTLTRLIDQYGIKNAFMLDVASNKISRMRITGVVGEMVTMIKKSDKLLDEKDDSDINVIIKTRSRKAVRLHNSMTNKLVKLCVQFGYKVHEGIEPNKFDALIKNYDGNGKDLLVEAKSSINRSHLRLAVGQLFDYRRGLRRRVATDLAVLLPANPGNDNIAYLRDVGVYILWFNNLKLNKILGDLGNYF